MTEYLAICIDKNSSATIARQITDGLRDAIVERRLHPNERLPAANHLSKILGVSRSTVLTACDELAGKGYLRMVPGVGMYVAESLPGNSAPPAAPIPQRSNVLLSRYGQRLLTHCAMPDIDRVDSAPSLDSTPLSIWKTLVRKHALFRDASLLEYDTSAAGHLPLREAYLSYLSRTRAVTASVDRLFVFPARELRLSLLCQLLLEPGDMVAVENPGYGPIRDRLRANGAKLFPIPVDEDGMDVDYLTHSQGPVRLVYVTPSHHEPTGAVLSMSRRHKLLEWAARTGALVIEDDYDCEFRYGSSSLPSLQSMDNSNSVIYISCVWKILSPVVKIGFVIVPAPLVKVLATAKALVERDMPMVDQFALADFIGEGHHERHISRLRSRYASRRQALLQALNEEFGTRVTVARETAGTDLLVRFDLCLDDERLLALAHDAGLAIFSSTPYYIGEGVPGEFVIPFANCTKELLLNGVKRFSSLVRNSSGL